MNTSTLLNPFTKRRWDGRTQMELRPPSAHVGLVPNAEGSARFALGNSSVLAIIAGPNECTKQRLVLNDRAAVDISIRPRSGSVTDKEIFLESCIGPIVRDMICLTAFPRGLISIVCQVLHDDGPMLPVVLSAVVLAFLDAGIPLRTTVLACAVGVTEEGELVVDPLTREAPFCSSLLTYAVDLHLKQPVTVLPVDERGGRAICGETQETMQALSRTAVASAAMLESFVRKTFDAYCEPLAQAWQESLEGSGAVLPPDATSTAV
eukprot:GDKH01025203.1.p1 GENE.GDKH01025203.1~~GDKH01025203.1.p1  ORF type:complete len:264 (+),score=15.86 GDKH01025203.1:66-857(+)